MRHLDELNQHSRIKHEHYWTERLTKVARILNPIHSEAALRAEHHFIPESYFFFASHSVMFVTSDNHAAIQADKPIGM
jgi:dipeptidase